MTELIFEEATEQDIPQLTQVMTHAFDDDSQKHLGRAKGGPEGYDNGDFFRKWLLPYKESVGYKILLAGQVIGGFIVWILPDLAIAITFFKWFVDSDRKAGKNFVESDSGNQFSKDFQELGVLNE